MGSGVWDLQVHEVMFSILCVTENTWTEGWKCGGMFEEQSSIQTKVCTYNQSNQNMTHSVSFSENVDSFSKVCVFLLYTEHTVR